MIDLYPHQLEVKREIYSRVREGHQRILVVAPCAFGKTILAASIIYDAAITKGKRVLFVAPYTCLIKQTQETLANYGIAVGLIAGGEKETRDALVQVATIQTLLRRSLWFDPDLIIFDETHILTFSSWAKKRFPPIKNHANEEGTIQNNNTFLNNSSITLIGLTATPWRLKRSDSMGDWFSTQVLAPTPGEMIANNFLVPLSYYGLPGANLRGVKTRGGDFETSQLGVACSVEPVIRSAVNNYQKICSDRLFIAFCVTVRHAQALMREFNHRGIKTAIVSAETPYKARQIIFKDIRYGTIRGIVSVDAIGIGFDVPQISCILDCRPTKSKSLCLQHWGRGQRLAPGKSDCIVLDQAGNLRRHGFIEDICYPDLRDSYQGQKGEAPVKECPSCQALVRLSEKRCPHCGFVFPIKKKFIPAGEMAKVDKNEFNLYREQEIKHFYREMRRKAFGRGWSPGVAIMKTREKYSLRNDWFPPSDWDRQSVLSDNPHNRTLFERYLSRVAENLKKTSDWIKMWIRREFN